MRRFAPPHCPSAVLGGSPLLQQGELDFSPAKETRANRIGFSRGLFSRIAAPLDTSPVSTNRESLSTARESRNTARGSRFGVHSAALGVPESV